MSSSFISSCFQNVVLYEIYSVKSRVANTYAHWLYMFRLSKSQHRHSFLLHSIFNMSNMTGATSGGGTSCLSGAMCLPPVFGECRVAQCSVCLLCSVLWTIILPFIARPVYCLSFGLHLHTHPYWTWIYRFSYLSLFLKYLHIHTYIVVYRCRFVALFSEYQHICSIHDFHFVSLFTKWYQICMMLPYISFV